MVTLPSWAFLHINVHQRCRQYFWQSSACTHGLPHCVNVLQLTGVTGAETKAGKLHGGVDYHV